VYASKLTFADGAPADQMFGFQPNDATVISVLSASAAISHRVPVYLCYMLRDELDTI